MQPKRIRERSLKVRICSEVRDEVDDFGVWDNPDYAMQSLHKAASKELGPFGPSALPRAPLTHLMQEKAWGCDAGNKVLELSQTGGAHLAGDQTFTSGQPFAPAYIHTRGAKCTCEDPQRGGHLLLLTSTSREPFALVNIHFSRTMSEGAI
eukprot:scaffold34742_cov29-Tisochrysis_lutea.AAC.1